MTVGAFAKAGGVGIETVRFYEREGLLPRPVRTRSNYRLYSRENLRRLRFIRQAAELGFSLPEVGRLLSLSANPAADAGDFHALASEKIRWIDEKIARLKEMRDVLAKAAENCPGEGHAKEECTILALFEDKEK